MVFWDTNFHISNSASEAETLETFCDKTVVIHVFLISNKVAKAQRLKLGQKLSNHLSNPKGLNQTP